jgi:glycosyltransferase involved in cell wall biosynthesis
LEELDLTGYDLVISSESGPAKGVITHPNAVHICYCHSPMRYLWDQYHVYRRDSDFLTRLFMSLAMPSLRRWDFATAARVDRFIANSTFVARRIEKVYRRKADIIFPPVDLDAFSITKTGVEDYYLYVGQLVSYKRADVAVTAFTRLGKRLIVVGSGAEETRLRSLAGPTITFKTDTSSAELAGLYQNAQALIFPGEEDFGIVPLEAMASGRPVLAYRSGGALDTVVDGITGFFFDKQTPESLIGTVQSFEKQAVNFQPMRIQQHARKFSKAAFKHRLTTLIGETLNSVQHEPAKAANHAWREVVA